MRIGFLSFSTWRAGLGAVAVCALAACGGGGGSSSSSGGGGGGGGGGGETSYVPAQLNPGAQVRIVDGEGGAGSLTWYGAGQLAFVGAEGAVAEGEPEYQVWQGASYVPAAAEGRATLSAGSAEGKDLITLVLSFSGEGRGTFVASGVDDEGPWSGGDADKGTFTLNNPDAAANHAPAALATGSKLTVTGDAFGRLDVTGPGTGTVTASVDGGVEVVDVSVEYARHATLANRATLTVRNVAKPQAEWVSLQLAFASATGGTAVANGSDEEDGAWSGEVWAFTFSPSAN